MSPLHDEVAVRTLHQRMHRRIRRLVRIRLRKRRHDRGLGLALQWESLDLEALVVEQPHFDELI